MIPEWALGSVFDSMAAAFPPHVLPYARRVWKLEGAEMLERMATPEGELDNVHLERIAEARAMLHSVLAKHGPEIMKRYAEGADV